MQIDWWTLALQTINFLVVVWLLSRFLYKPIKRVIEEREAADRKAAEIAEEKVRAAEDARASFEARQAEFAQAQRSEETRLHAEMEKEREATLEAARSKAADLLAQAQDRIAQERQRALADLSDQIADLAADIARQALGEEGALQGDSLLDSVTRQLDHMPESDLAEMRRDIERNGGGLRLVTATPLSDDLRDKWRDALAARFGSPDTALETDPRLLGGIDLQFPHAVLSFSVAGRLKRAAQDLKAR